MPNPFLNPEFFAPPIPIGSGMTPGAAMGSPFGSPIAPAVGAAPTPFDVPGAATPPLAAPPPMPMPAFTTNRPPAPAAPNFQSMALPLIAAALLGRNDPRAVAEGIAGFMRGRELKRAETESLEDRTRRRQQEQADFYGRALSQAQAFDDPVAFEQWKAAIAPVAQVHGIDANVFTFNDQKLAARTKKEAGDLLDALDKQHPDGIYSADWKDPKTGVVRRIPRADLATFAGRAAYDAQGQSLAPSATVSAQRFVATVRTPDGTTKQVYAFEDPKTRKVTDATGQDITRLIEPPTPEPKKYEVTVPGPNGRPVKKLVTDAELTQGITQYEKPEKDTGTAAPVEIKPGTPAFRVAQDLAYGKLTFGGFRTLYAYSRNADLKSGIYAKAADLNPNFNPAAFEMGYALAKNPKVQQQLASMDNVVQAVPDLLKVSDAASRTGVTAINKLVNKGGYLIGGKRYSNFRIAQTAFADELSGALGYGSATDMSREMGFNMTDPNLSPDNFSSGMTDIVVPFIDRKRSTLLKQMGIYGTSDFQPGGGAPPIGNPISGAGAAPNGKIRARDPQGNIHEAAAGTPLPTDWVLVH